MTSFEQLQDLWHHQTGQNTVAPDEIIRRAELGTKAIKRKHKGTILILSATVLLLLVYFLAYRNGVINQALGGLLLMVLSLLVRIAAEMLSYRRFNAINSNSSLQDYTAHTVLFYQFRKKILLLLTPLILIVYAMGFMLLLPAAKQHVSHGFYIYIICSGLFFAIFITVLIINQTRKELKLLRFLMGVQAELNKK
jgi:hypothetical protein